MTLDLRIVALVGFVLASSPVTTWTQAAPDAKVVFLKGTALVTANVDGSKVRVLVDDGVKKFHPEWSPRGDKIFYEIEGQQTKNPKEHVRFVIVTASGRLLSAIPVYATTLYGSKIEGKRFVEWSGWYSNEAVYAEGSANPYTGEYDIFDVKSGQMIEALSAAGIAATCAANGKVAYEPDLRWESDSSQGDRVLIRVNQITVYEAKRPATGDFVLRDLHWSADCSRLALLEDTETTTTLVVLRATTVEAKVPFPQDMIGGLTVTNHGGSFVFRNAIVGKALFYDTTNHTLRAAPDILQQLQQREDAEAQVMQTLGGQSPDWYRPSR